LAARLIAAQSDSEFRLSGRAPTKKRVSATATKINKKDNRTGVVFPHILIGAFGLGGFGVEISEETTNKGESLGFVETDDELPVVITAGADFLLAFCVNDRRVANANGDMLGDGADRRRVERGESIEQERNSQNPVTRGSGSRHNKKM
jgi:hypothetical protein